MVLNIFSGRRDILKKGPGALQWIDFVFSLLYGFSQPSSIYYYYRHYSFYYRADENGVKLPKIHLILCKVTPPNKESKIGLGGNTPSAEEIDKCWRFCLRYLYETSWCFRTTLLIDRNTVIVKWKTSDNDTTFINYIIIITLLCPWTTLLSFDSCDTRFNGTFS